MLPAYTMLDSVKQLGAQFGLSIDEAESASPDHLLGSQLGDVTEYKRIKISSRRSSSSSEDDGDDEDVKCGAESNIKQLEHSNTVRVARQKLQGIYPHINKLACNKVQTPGAVAASKHNMAMDGGDYGGTFTFEDYLTQAKGSSHDLQDTSQYDDSGGSQRRFRERKEGLGRNTNTSKSCYARRPKKQHDVEIYLDTDSNSEHRARSGSVGEVELRLSRNHLFPDYNQEEDGCLGLRRVRSFKTTSKGEIVNRGDSFKRKQGRYGGEGRYGGAASNNADTQPRPQFTAGGQDSSTTPGDTTEAYKVLMLGRAGVGKTALVQQFATSEYMGADTPGLDEYFEKSVAVQLDEKESTLNFFVLPSNEEFSKYSGVDAYVIVYSVADKSSFKQTKEHTKFIRKHISREMPIIIVGNKSDIVRQRQITPEDGKNAATQLDCKFIETSATLNHQVDDLLVGILSQIRLFKKGGDSHHKHAKAMNPKGALTKFLQKHNVVTKSCDNLLVK
ncbi:unnamed protein product [Owenia fusiformis]|uniref:Uncharacterized protein n=1 Tax=Owenia fusiformis TaxID=6347 RepID=A0A8J1TTP6_OWEFU|nr:unnamed protein product [Owenia fusiformis]